MEKYLVVSKFNKGTVIGFPWTVNSHLVLHELVNL